MNRDITDLVEFGNNDDEHLPLTKCACGQRFDWWDFAIGIYPDDPAECSNCGRQIYFAFTIRVFEITPNNALATELLPFDGSDHSKPEK